LPKSNTLIWQTGLSGSDREFRNNTKKRPPRHFIN
jgi:hypothetical protein